MHQYIRIKFSKTGVLRFISHQDTMRLFERAIRRSGLPVKMSEGYNPKPQIAYLLALGVGLESEAECVTLRMGQWTRTGEVVERLTEQLPEGIQVCEVMIVGPNQKPTASRVAYTVRAQNADAVTQEQVDLLLQSECVSVHRIRKGKPKTVNIRPYIRELTKAGDRLHMVFDVTTTGTANPIEVLRALGAELDDVHTQMRIVRTELN